MLVLVIHQKRRFQNQLVLGFVLLVITAENEGALPQDGFAGANILGIANGANAVEAAAVQAGEQLIGPNGSIPQAPAGSGASQAAVAPTSAVDLVNNGL